MNTRRFEIYAPVQDFRWSGEDFELAPGVLLKRFQTPPDLEGLNEWVGREEWERASKVSHWLTFERRPTDALSPTEIENLVLLALWLSKPTRAHIALRFELGRGSADQEKSRNRLLDRFQWVPGAVELGHEEVDLQRSAAFYQSLVSVCASRGRLNDALILTLSACWSVAWQVALICHSAAAEALLTYASGSGITRRLSTTYACMVESQQMRRVAAFKEFSELYSARSDVIHGRTHNVATGDRLPTLGRFQNVLRTLWATVLLSPQLVSVLEGTDAQRKAHFSAMQNGFTPPP